MRQSMESFLGVVGLLILAGGYAGSVFGIVHDPLDLFFAVCVGLLLAAWFCFSSLTDRVEPDEAAYKLYLPAGTQPSRKARPLRRSMRVRVFSIFVLLCSVVGTIGILVAERQTFDMVYLSEPQVSPVVKYLQVASQDDGTATAFDIAETPVGKQRVRFTITKRHQISWLEVESVTIQIDSYEPKPHGLNFVAQSSVPKQELFRVPVTYSATLEKAAVGGQVTADYVIPASREAGGVESFGTMVLSDGYPMPFVIELCGSQPGIYRYSVNVGIRHLWRSQMIAVHTGQFLMLEPEQEFEDPVF